MRYSAAIVLDQDVPPELMGAVNSDSTSLPSQDEICRWPIERRWRLNEYENELREWIAIQLSFKSLVVDGAVAAHVFETRE